MGVKSGCKPRDDVRQGELDDAIFAASFGKLIRNEGPEIYKDHKRFFENTHPTAALSKLCRDVFGRLASTTESGAVLRLSTGFGGGNPRLRMIFATADVSGIFPRRNRFHNSYENSYERGSSVERLLAYDFEQIVW